MQNYQHAIGGEWTLAKIAYELEHHLGLGCEGDWPGGQVGLHGFCLYRRPSGGDFSEIMLIASHPQWSRQGLASRLINELKARLQPGEKLWLEVHHLNIPAVKLYERSGFSKVGERKTYYSDGGHAWLYEFTKKSNL